MRVLFEVGHPAHVHLFKSIAYKIREDGHEILFAVRERENTVSDLLKHYGFEYEMMIPTAESMVGKAIALMKNDFSLLKIGRNFNPAILINVGSAYSAHVSRMLGKPHICLTDTEDATLQLKLMVPFTKTILTPDCFLKQFPPKKHIRYPGYHELAYLHPSRFTPDSSVLEYLGVEKGEKYVMMRFSAWDASHDVGQHGFKSDEERLAIIEEIEKYAKVFISSEIPLRGKLDKRRINIPIHRIHDALYYASLYVGDGHKMAAESGILGTPSIIVSTRWDRTGNFKDFVEKYGIVEAFKDVKPAQQRALDILRSGKKAEDEWRGRAKKMLEEKIDVASFLTYFIENYPHSHRESMEGRIFERFIYMDD